MENIYRLGKTNRVDRAISIAAVVLDDLKDSSASESPQRLGRRMYFTSLSEIESKSNVAADASRESSDIFLTTACPMERLSWRIPDPGQYGKFTIVRQTQASPFFIY